MWHAQCNLNLTDDAMMTQVTLHEVTESVCVLTLDMFYMVC